MLNVNVKKSAGENDVITKTVQLDPELFGGNYWLSRSGLNTARKNSASFSLGGYIFCTAGFASANSSAHESYNDSTNLWTAKTNFSLGATTKLIGFSLSLGYAGFGTTGSNSAAIAAYNEFSNTWSSKSSGSVTRNGFCGTNLNGYGYAVQGFTTVVTNINERYDEALNSWTTKAAALISADENAVTAANGYLVSMFGRTAPGTTNTADSSRYDDASNSWLTISASSGTVRSGVSGFSSTGIIGTVTGRMPSGATNFANNDQLNISIRSWSTKAPNLSAISLAVGASMNGDGYVVGGQNGSGGAGNGLSTVTMYKNYHLFTIPFLLKSTAKEPFKIKVTTLIDNAEYQLPVKLRSNGTDWKSQISGIDSTVVKTGETLSSTFTTIPATGFRGYEAQIGLPKSVSGLGGGLWLIKSAGTAKFRNQGISLNGKGYSIAGNSAAVNTRTNTIHQYNDYIDTWTLKSSISSVKQGTFGFDLEGAGYSAGGGISNGTVDNTVDKYNDESNLWSAVTAITTSRECGAGYSMNGLGYAVGGATADSAGNPSTLSAVNEKYNSNTNVWTTMAPFTTARKQISAFTVNQMGYVCAGNTSASAGGTTSSGLNARFNDSSNTWLAMTVLSTNVLGSFTFVIKNKAYISLGFAAANTTITQQYDDGLNIWSTKSSSIGTARREGASFALNNSGYAVCGFVSAAVNEVNQYVINDQLSNIQFDLNISSTP